jgi:hypothetical protein
MLQEYEVKWMGLISTFVAVGTTACLMTRDEFMGTHWIKSVLGIFLILSTLFLIFKHFARQSSKLLTAMHEYDQYESCDVSDNYWRIF